MMIYLWNSFGYEQMFQIIFMYFEYFQTKYHIGPQSSDTHLHSFLKSYHSMLMAFNIQIQRLLYFLWQIFQISSFLYIK